MQSRRIIQSTFVASVIGALTLLGAFALGVLLHDPTAAARLHQNTAPAVPVPVSPELEQAEWWTTTDCPEGVAVPCLDPTADPALVPDHVRMQLKALIEAEWACLHQVDEALPDGAVRVKHDQAEQCRQQSYAAH